MRAWPIPRLEGQRKIHGRDIVGGFEGVEYRAGIDQGIKAGSSVGRNADQNSSREQTSRGMKIFVHFPDELSMITAYDSYQDQRQTGLLRQICIIV